MSIDTQSLKPARGGTIVLSKNNRYKIKTGRVVEFHFKGSQFYNGQMVIYLHNEKIASSETKRISKSVKKESDIVFIQLNKDTMDKIENNLVLGKTLDTEPKFQIEICSHEFYSKTTMNQ